MLRLNSKTDAQLLDERIAEIRRKNEERQKRFLEVEADKQNAARKNALVQLSAPKDNWCADRVEYNSEPRPSGPDCDDQQTDHNIEISRPSRNTEVHSSSRNRAGGDVSFNEPSSRSSRRPEMLRARPSARNKLTANVSESGAISYIFPEGEGPPPDPAYNFLRDDERDPEQQDRGNYRKKSPRRRQPRGQLGPGKNRFNDSRALNDGLEVPRTDPRYEAWKAERERIDQERINRQKTADGQWRREWDKGKVPVEAMDDEPLQKTRSGYREAPLSGYRNPEPRRMEDFIRGVDSLAIHNDPPLRRSFREKQRSNMEPPRRISSSPENPVSILMQPPGPRKLAVARRKCHENQHCDRGPSPAEITPVVQVRMVPSSMKEPVTKQLSNEKQHEDRRAVPKMLSPAEIISASKRNELRSERNVMSVGNTIQICVSNDAATKQSPDLHKVKVNSRTAIGTGRVGPRQKIRLSYSSQSEDEVVHQNSQQLRRSMKHSQSRAPCDYDSAENPASAKPPRPPPEMYRDLAKPRRFKEPRPRKKTENNVSSDQSSENKSGTDSATDERESKPESSVTDMSKETESDDDDDWEDVTTTSGNESISAEDFIPTRKVLARTVVQDCNEGETIDDEVMNVVVDADHTNKDTFLPASSENGQEEFSEKGNYEPSEKHDGPSCEQTPVVPLQENLTKDLNNKEELGTTLDSVLNPGNAEPVCPEGPGSDLGQCTISNDSCRSTSNVAVDKATNERNEETKREEEISASLELKDKNASIEPKENADEVTDSNILTEQNCKAESS